MNRGPSRPTLYEVQLPVFGRSREYLKFFCQTTAIPSVSVQTTTANGQEYQGIVREQPLAVVYGKPFTMTIIENKDFGVYKDLRGWFDSCAVNANPTQISRTQRMNYYETFVRDMTLTKLENGGSVFGPGYDRPLSVTFFSAFPVSIGQISLGSDQYDTSTTYEISFSYESYNVSYNTILDRFL